METNYEMNEKVDIISWSTCGDHTAILNVNSEVRISPQTSRDKGLMTVSLLRQSASAGIPLPLNLLSLLSTSFLTTRMWALAVRLAILIRKTV